VKKVECGHLLRITPQEFWQVCERRFPVGEILATIDCRHLDPQLE
jgi:hypothetical protein